MTVLHGDSEQDGTDRAAAAGRAWRTLAWVGSGWTLALMAAVPPAIPGGGWAAGLVMALATLIAAQAMARHYPHARTGACNLITLSRAVPVALLAAVLLRPGGLGDDAALAWAVTGVVAAGLALDGVDGGLARRSGLVSAFGARFDMEVDAALAALLAVVALVSGKAGVWVLALGGLRYGFLAAMAVRPWLALPLPPSLRRKTVCVVQIGVLAALLAPPVVPPWSALAGLAALALLVWSFAVDILWLRRQG